jgi:hypothetical protein
VIIGISNKNSFGVEKAVWKVLLAEIERNKNGDVPFRRMDVPPIAQKEGLVKVHPEPY